MVSVGETDAELMKNLKKYSVDWDDDFAYENSGVGRFVINEKNQSLLRLKRKPTTPDDKGFLAHEIFHAVEFLFEKIRLPHTTNSGEAYAYLIGYITTEIYKNIKNAKS